MADTTIIPVVDTAWTLVATGASIGFITNEGIHKLKYVEDDALPSAASNDGHTLEGVVGAFVAYDVAAGQNVYIKSTNGNSQVAVTPE